MSVNPSVKSEIQASNTKIAELKDYQSKFWAIGLNGDTLQPDCFLTFFTERNLPFAYFVSAQGINIGDSSAYQTNSNTLIQYMNNLRTSEKTAVNAIVADLKAYKAKNWAIGLNGDNLQPDGFLPFFGARSIPFAYYVRSGDVSLGDPSAYDTNIKALNDYIASLG